MQKIYTTLLEAYGPQGWWPIQGVYKQRNHLTKNQQYEVCVGAILTQNTAWTNVQKALQNLQPVTPQHIESLNENKLKQAIRPAGYFNQKAKKIQIFTKFFKKTKAPTRDELLNLWGIGPETADSILLYAYNQPVFVIDAYTKRICTRLGICKDKVTYNDLQKVCQTQLRKEQYNQMHALFVEHAKRHCTTKPKCTTCPLKQNCAYQKLHKGEKD